MELKDKVFIPIFTLALFTSILFLSFTMTGKFAYIEQTMDCGEGNCEVICRYQDDCMNDEICCEIDGSGICKQATQCNKIFNFIEGSQVVQTNNERYPTQEKDTANILTVILFILLIGIAYLLSRKHHKKHFSNSKRRKR